MIVFWGVFFKIGEDRLREKLFLFYILLENIFCIKVF